MYVIVLRQQQLSFGVILKNKVVLLMIIHHRQATSIWCEVLEIYKDHKSNKFLMFSALFFFLILFGNTATLSNS
jgi:hypothetical protein